MFCKQEKQKLDRIKLQIFEDWKTNWLDKNLTDSMDYFFDLYTSNYEYIRKKVRHYKRLNFFWKLVFLFVLIVGYTCCVLLFLHDSHSSRLMDLVENGFFLLLVTLACGAISKWIDIAKYQETWARYSQHLFSIEKEMLLFVMEQEPYGILNKKELFIKNVLKIWQSNEDKFAKNLEQNEEKLMDLFEYLKSK